LIHIGRFFHFALKKIKKAEKACFFIVFHAIAPKF